MQKIIDKPHSSKLIAIAAAFLAIALPSVSSAEAWELRTTPDAVPGTHEIESGEIDKAIRLSRNWLSHIDRQKKVAVLNNLCIAYTLNKEYGQAEEYCDRAVERYNHKTVSYNNRGVLKALQGNYEGAAQDFANASNAGCDDNCSNAVPKDQQQPRAVALRNHEKAEFLAEAASMDDKERVAAIAE